MRGKNLGLFGICVLLGIILLSLNLVSAANAATLTVPVASANVSGTQVITATLDTNTLNLTYAWFTYSYNNGTTVVIASGVANPTTLVFNTSWNSATAKDGNNITFSVTVTNETGGVQTAGSSNTSDDSTGVTVDNTAPTIALLATSYANGTLKTNAQNITKLNITIDDINMTTASMCKINVNGTNQTLSLTSIAANTTHATCNTTDVRLTNAADGNTTINIYANNSVGLWGWYGSYVVTVDTLPPAITLPHYVNGTIKKNSETLTLNVSVSDAVTSMSACKIEINGTNTTVAINASGYCNIASIPLTNLGDGNHTIKVYVNNTQNLFGWSNTYAVYTDTTGPSVDLTATEIGRDTITLAINADEGLYGTGAASCTADRAGATVTTTTLTESGLSCATTYTYVVTCTDRAGNTGSATKTLSTNGCGSTGGGGGGTTTKSVVNSASEIKPGAATVMKYSDPVVGVKEISIEVNNPAQNVKITVTKEAGKPAVVSVAKTGKVYQYIHIETQNLADKLDKATVQFKVEKSWATTNNVDKSNVIVSKFDETAKKWNGLTTTYVSEDTTHYYYNVDVTSFSYFAISDKSTVAAGEEETTATGEEGGGSLLWLWILIGVVIVVAIGWGVGKKKKR